MIAGPTRVAERPVVTRRLDRWAWEATVKVTGRAWVVAYAPCRRLAVRRLNRKLTSR